MLWGTSYTILRKETYFVSGRMEDLLLFHTRYAVLTRKEHSPPAGSNRAFFFIKTLHLVQRFYEKDTCCRAVTRLTGGIRIRYSAERTVYCACARQPLVCRCANGDRKEGSDDSRLPRPACPRS